MPKFAGPPMDLANVRSLGVTRVDVCCACGHQASVDVSNCSPTWRCRTFGLSSGAHSVVGQPKPGSLVRVSAPGQIVGHGDTTQPARELLLDHRTGPEFGPIYD